MSVVTKIYQDQNLYGHFLLDLPHKIWSFSTGKYCLYERSDPGTRVVDQNYILAKAVHYRRGNTYIYRTEIFFEKPLLDLIEFVGRRILCPPAAAVSFLTLCPIGFTAKLLHLSIRQISIFVASSLLAEKIRRIWNDPSLFGHSLTSAPLKCYQFAASPLSWHLRRDGTDRRSYIVGGGVVLQAEYQLVPFELLEFIYKRIMGGALTLSMGIVAPVGLLAKSVHLASQSLFH